MILFGVNVDGNNSQDLSSGQDLPGKENDQQNVELDSTDRKEKTTMETLLELFKAFKQLEGSKDETYAREWQIIAKIFDRLMFILNILSMVISFGYCYTKLYA